MVLIVVGYYLHWPTTRVLDLLAAGKALGGHFFTFVATGLFGGVLSEACRITLLQGGRWEKRNGDDMRFKFLLMGSCGVLADLFYGALGHLLGDTPSVGLVIKKTFIDQFIYSPFLAVPIMAIVIHWRNSGYRRVPGFFNAAFVEEEVVPLAVTNACFWLPVVAALYSLPLPLQVPLFLLASSIWGLILISVAARKNGQTQPTADIAQAH